MPQQTAAGQVLVHSDPAWLTRLVTRRARPETLAQALERETDETKVIVQFSEARSGGTPRRGSEANWMHTGFEIARGRPVTFAPSKRAVRVRRRGARTHSDARAAPAEVALVAPVRCPTPVRGQTLKRSTVEMKHNTGGAKRLRPEAQEPSAPAIRSWLRRAASTRARGPTV